MFSARGASRTRTRRTAAAGSPGGATGSGTRTGSARSTGYHTASGTRGADRTGARSARSIGWRHDDG